MIKKIPLKLAAVVTIVFFGLIVVASALAPLGVTGGFWDALSGRGSVSGVWTIAGAVLSAFAVTCSLMRGGFITRRLPEGLMTVFLWLACIFFAFNAVFSLATFNGPRSGISFIVTLIASVALGRLAAEPRSPKQPANPALKR